MANRRIEMHQYRQVIHRMRQGQSDRAIAKSQADGQDQVLLWSAPLPRKMGGFTAARFPMTSSCQSCSRSQKAPTRPKCR